MQGWVYGNQIKRMGPFEDIAILQGCIAKSLTPHNDQGLPVMPADVMVRHIADLEQELSKLDELAWDLRGADREKMIHDDIDPLQERLQNCRTYHKAVGTADWDEFELPAEKDLLGRFYSFLMASKYTSEEVERFLRKPSEAGLVEGAPFAEAKSANSQGAQKVSEKCREIASRIWERQPDFSIAAMINHSEIIRQARKPDGSPYSEITIRNWIRDLCPNPRPGRRSSPIASDSAIK
jgi:hypothetical protein